MSYLARYLDAVEINTTFYRIAPPRLAEGWLEAVRDRPRFLFSMKLWQGFTHESAEIDSPAARSVAHVAQILAQENRLACVLAQFPWSFRYGEAQVERIRQLAGAFSQWRLVVEVRHGSWLRDEYLELLRRLGCGFCNIDQPVIGASVPPTAIMTAPPAYIRLHGRRYDTWFAENEDAAKRYDYLYNREEIAEWVERIRQLAAKAEKTLVIANNHFNAKAVATILEMNHLLTGDNPAAPPEILAAYPHLRAFCVEQPAEPHTQEQLALF